MVEQRIEAVSKQLTDILQVKQAEALKRIPGCLGVNQQQWCKFLDISASDWDEVLSGGARPSRYTDVPLKLAQTIVLLAILRIKVGDKRAVRRWLRQPQGEGTSPLSQVLAGKQQRLRLLKRLDAEAHTSAKEPTVTAAKVTPRARPAVVLSPKAKPPVFRAWALEALRHSGQKSRAGSAQ